MLTGSEKAEADPELEEKYLLDEPVADQIILERLKNLSQASALSAVVFTSEKNGEGLETLLKTAVSCLPDTKQAAGSGLSGRE